MTSYMINARKKPYRKKHNNKYSYAVRFYFTSAKIVKSDDEPEEEDFDLKDLEGTAKKVAGGGFLTTAQLMMLQENESRKSVMEAYSAYRTPFEE